MIHFRKKRFRIYHFIVLLPLILFSISQLGCLSFRMSNAKQEEYLLKTTQRKPDFIEYQKNGRTIHYTRVAESDSLPVIIFLHGSPGSSSAYIDYLSDKRLSKVAQLISVDRPGFGYSDYGKSEGSLEEQASLMKPIVEKYLPNRVILAGHSLGGPLAVRMAMDYPELISGIVLVAPSVAPELEPKDGWYRKPMNWFFIRWMFPKSFVVSNQEILPLREELTKMLPLWQNINLPVTVIQGDKDKFVPMENAAFAKKMLVNAPEVKVVMIPNGSHFILWTEYEKVVQEILGILYN